MRPGDAEQRRDVLPFRYDAVRRSVLYRELSSRGNLLPELRQFLLRPAGPGLREPGYGYLLRECARVWHGLLRKRPELRERGTGHLQRVRKLRRRARVLLRHVLCGWRILRHANQVVPPGDSVDRKPLAHRDSGFGRWAARRPVTLDVGRSSQFVRVDAPRFSTLL